MSNSNKASLKELENYLNSMSKKLEKNHINPLLNDIGNILRNSIENSFEEEKDPITLKSWKKLKQTTIKRKQKLKKSNKILRDSGFLAGNWHIRITSSDVSVFNNSKNNGFHYGIVHNFGNKNTPQRGFLPIRKGKIAKDVKDKIEAKIVRYIVKD